MAACPRGSFMSNCLTPSRCSRNHRRRSFMVAPGIVPMPPGITRVGMPLVWESTACRTSVLRMTGLLLLVPVWVQHAAREVRGQVRLQVMELLGSDLHRRHPGRPLPGRELGQGGESFAGRGNDEP